MEEALQRMIRDCCRATAKASIYRSICSVFLLSTTGQGFIELKRVKHELKPS